MTLVEEATRFILEKVSETPLVVFVSGPQGSGKTYSSQAIHKRLQKERPDLNCVYVSIDDFYLTHADQQVLSNKNPDNPLLQGRGLPGTHDMPLLEEFVAHLGTNAHGSMQIPQYDKGRFRGEGDRVSPKTVELPVNVVIIEGWFLGFNAVGEELLTRMREEDSPRGQALRVHDLQQLLQIDASLRDYARVLWSNPEIRSVGVILAADVANVYRWRAEQEHQLVAKQGSGMTEEEVRKFVERYMPCYEVYYGRLKQEVSLGSQGTLEVGIDEHRRVLYVKST